MFQPFNSSETLPPSHFLASLPAPSERLVLKPNWGYHGYGFMLVQRQGTEYLLNGSVISPTELTGLLHSLEDYLVVEYVQQAAYAQDIFPGSANTLRLLTAWDERERRPFLVCAVHRFGVQETSPVDNFTAGKGGLSVLIDPVTGSLGPAAHVNAAYRVDWLDRHPQTHSPITGVKVPRWTQIRDTVLEFATRLPFLIYIGWDVVVTETGFSVLELNQGSGLSVLQVHGPLLSEPTVRRFYRDRGIIS